MRVLKNLNLDDLIFIDIETTRIVKDLEEDTPLYDSWEYKMRNSREAEDGELTPLFLEKASLYPEFSKITCISCGILRGNKPSIKSYTGDEKDILLNFTKDLHTITDIKPKAMFCAHAGIGFDIPFIMKRCLINGVELHDLIDVSGLKPWEVNIIDTNVIWKATSFTGASLINICVALGVPSPKTDLSGAEAAKLYWDSEDQVEAVKKIAKYCEQDVQAVINIVLKCRGEEIPKKRVESTGLSNYLFNGGEYGEKQKREAEELLDNAGDLRKECFEILSSIARKKNTPFKMIHVKELKTRYNEN
jgi:uncharacterized protein YprB with RNaseH-like and TPR domain